MNLRKQGIKLIASLPFSVFSKLDDGKMKVETRHNSSFLCWFSIRGRLGSKTGLRVSWILFSSLPYSLLFRLFLYPGPASDYPVLSSSFIILEPTNQPTNQATVYHGTSNAKQLKRRLTNSYISRKCDGVDEWWATNSLENWESSNSYPYVPLNAISVTLYYENTNVLYLISHSNQT